MKATGGSWAATRMLLPVIAILLAGCSRQASPPPTVADRLEIVTATPGPERRPTSPPPVAATYVVAEGDTVSGIAERFDVSTGAILEANDLDNPDRVMVGQALVIPPPEP